MFLYGFAEEGTGHPLVKQHGQYRYHTGLQQIQRRHAEENKGCDGVDFVVNGGAHADDGIQGNAVELSKFGQQIDGIECGTENGDADAADDQTDDGGMLALVQMVEIVLKKISPSLYSALGIFLPLITTNCAVLGVALTVVQKSSPFAAAADGMFNLGEATIYAFATSLGFGLAMILFAGLREQLALNDVPKAFKGIPIALVTAGFLAMAFMGFSGLV